MTCLMLSQVRFKVAGSWAIAFQKLLIQSVLRVVMMSSYTARTSGLASAYSISLKVAMVSPRDLQTLAGMEASANSESLCGWPWLGAEVAQRRGKLDRPIGQRSAGTQRGGQLEIGL